jgi:hypothetical protein
LNDGDAVVGTGVDTGSETGTDLEIEGISEVTVV